MMALLFAPFTVKADEITVGTATDAKNLAPFLNSYQNSWLEMVYTSEEIGQACNIGSIAFKYVDGPTLETNDIRIYLAETTKTKFANVSEWTPEDELTLVYSGTNVVLGDDEWETFEFDTPFNYSGEKNLAVVVAKTANYYQLTLTWACYDDPSSIMFTGNVNNDQDESYAQYPTADGLAIYSKKPVMKLTVTEAQEVAKLEAPKNLRASIRQDLPDYDYKYEITMAWDAVAGAKGYDVYVNTATATDYYMGYTNGTFYVAGANQEGTLEFYVKAFNDETESDPSEAYTITIVDDAVEELSSSFTIYPNPVENQLFVTTESSVEEVSIFTLTGALVSQQTTINGQQTSSIDVSELNSGVYFVRIKTNDGERVERFIKK